MHCLRHSRHLTLFWQIKNEQKEALAAITVRRAECQGLFKDSNDIIASSSITMYQNYQAVEQAKTQTLPNNLQLWDDSRALEDATHAILVAEQAPPPLLQHARSRPYCNRSHTPESSTPGY